MSPEETLGSNIDIPSEKCTCVAGFACDYCIQEYKKSCRSTPLALRQPLATVQTTVCHNEVFHGQEGILNELAIIRGLEQPFSNQNQVTPEENCPDDQKSDAESQHNGELSPNRDASSTDSDNNSCFSAETKNSDTEDGKESEDDDVERIKQVTMEQYRERRDSETKFDADCPLPQESATDKPDGNVFADSVGGNCKRTRRGKFACCGSHACVSVRQVISVDIIKINL